MLIRQYAILLSSQGSLDTALSYLERAASSQVNADCFLPDAIGNVAFFAGFSDGMDRSCVSCPGS